MREHSLKTWPSYFAAIQDGTKTFEVRYNDRDYAVGDVLCLKEWDPTSDAVTGMERGYSRAQPIRAEVTYILHGGQFGVPEGMCIMALRVLSFAALEGR